MALTRFSKSNCEKLCSWKITGISAVHPSLQILTLNQARPSEKYKYQLHCFDPWANGDKWGNADVGLEFNGWDKNHSFLLGPTFGNKSRVSSINLSYSASFFLNGTTYVILTAIYVILTSHISWPVLAPMLRTWSHHHFWSGQVLEPPIGLYLRAPSILSDRLLNWAS